MAILQGLVLLLIVLFLFTLFSYRAPHGMKAMGALANAAIASFLIEAFHRYIGGEMFHNDFLKSVGEASGSMSGVAAAILVALAIGVSPVYAILIGIATSGFGILPGFSAGYVCAFIVKFLEKKLPAGLEFLAILLIAAPISRGMAMLMDPLVNVTLIKIGSMISVATTESPIIMGIMLGGLITVISTSPLSSMALTAMLGLTGLPMAIGSLAVAASAPMNFIFFKRLQICSKKDTIAVAIEPLTQADVVVANPLPIYTTNFVGGAFAGVITALFGLVNNAPGTASPIPGLFVLFGFNDVIKVTIAAIACGIITTIIGYIGTIVFRQYPLQSADKIRRIIPKEKVS
ncbi:PTS sugar transporter subunit IIC [Bacillus thuringiensis]|uniref:PTS sugar transporter subunit IIC n=1 Tax=Bacillus thuringiensis TaxID=1428 RepID=UPI000A38D9E7|nr:PTS sugar transporter subunit IIC [Bacillus thuringiensis]OUA98499.1 transcriptional regulator [Bacillus thuringiensis serovar leesis]